MAAADLSDLVRLVQLTGHYCNFEGNQRELLLKKLQLLRVVFMVLGNPFTLSSLVMGGIKNTIGIETYFGLMGILTALQHVYAYIHRKDTEDIIRCIKNFREKYQKDSDDEFQENTRVIWKNVHIYFWAMTALLVGYMILPKFADLVYYGIIWDDPIVHIRVPMSMDAYLDKNQERNTRYLLVSLVSVSWAAISIYSHFGLDSFLYLVGFYYSSIVNTFCSRLYIDTNDRSIRTTAKIKNVAVQHRELFLLSQKIRGLFGFPYALQNLFGAFCIVSLLYSLLSDDSGGLPILLANLFNLMLLTSMLTNTAYVGQHVTDESETIFQAIYNMPWYELRPNDRKYFITMLCAAREPFTIHYHGRAPLNFANFMVIMNTSYSYFMFMKSAL